MPSRNSLCIFTSPVLLAAKPYMSGLAQTLSLTTSFRSGIASNIYIGLHIS